MTTQLSLESFGDAAAELTDRERLALAFGILRERGWFAPIEWASSQCCSQHGWIALLEHFAISEADWLLIPSEDEPPSIWWTKQLDSAAFCGSPEDMPHTPDMVERIDAVYDALGQDGDALTEWMDEHSDELDADEVIARQTLTINLIDTLELHWSGGIDKMIEAVEVLRSVGLPVSPAETFDRRIQVHAKEASLRVCLRPDNYVSMWFGASAQDYLSVPADRVMSYEDAVRLRDHLTDVLGDVPPITN